MKDSSISKYHLFSGVSVMVIAYLTLTTVVLYLKCFKLYVPDFLDALRTQGMSANMYSDLFLIVFPAVGTTKQFWIYISKQKIPLKYQHRINQICSSVRHERIIVPYSDKLLSMLVSKLPQPLGKRLNNTTSILRIYKCDVDE